MEKAFVIGYKNHALRIIKHLVDINFFEQIIVFHPEKDKLKTFYKIHPSLSLSSNFNDVSLCSSVFISSPAETHCYYLKQILNLSKTINKLPYIYCEKPVVTNTEEINWLNKNFNDIYSRLYVGFNQIHSNFSKTAISYVKNKKIGKPISAFFQISHGLATKKKFKNNWRAQSSNPFSQLIGNLSIHQIHLSLMLFGDIKSYLFIESNSFKNKNNDSMSILLQHNNDVQTHIFCSYATILSRRSTIYFTDGLLEQTIDGVKLWTPRDTFNDKGEYTLPPELEISKESEERDITLKNSLNYFIEKLKNDSNFSKIELLNGIKASEEILKISSKNCKS